MINVASFKQVNVKAFIFLVAFFASFTVIAKGNDQPNILLIVADDLGYSDIGSFGGEIKTPNLDLLAKAGIRMTSFHTAPTCSPTRSMLLSGTDSHQAGLGNMAELLQDNQKGKPGYEGHLNKLVASLPEVLKKGGYHTYMAGKWHLGRSEETSPAANGFEKSFVLLQGGASHFGDQLGIMAKDRRALYREDGKLVDIPKEFFSTEFYTNQMISYIDSNLNDDRPFLGYVAYTAPHWPLQAPESYIDKYKGKYDKGYSSIRKERLRRMKELGIIERNTKSNVATTGLPTWGGLTEAERKEEARKMEVYAAMVENMDHHIGRLLGHLKEKGELDNTVIMFMSDNGAEGNSPGKLPGNSGWIASDFDNTFENMGRKNSYVWYGPQWGQVGATPFPLYKSYTSQGGIIAPAILSYPGMKKRGSFSNVSLSVMDVMPTFLEFAGIKKPDGEFNGRKVYPMKGISMLESFANKNISKNRVIGWELFGRRAIRKGDWKIRLMEPPYGFNQWELFNLKNDPTEQNNLARSETKKLAELVSEWKTYKANNGVILPNTDRLKRMGYSFGTCLYDKCL